MTSDVAAIADADATTAPSLSVARSNRSGADVVDPGGFTVAAGRRLAPIGSPQPALGTEMLTRNTITCHRCCQRPHRSLTVGRQSGGRSLHCPGAEDLGEDGFPLAFGKVLRPVALDLVSPAAVAPVLHPLTRLPDDHALGVQTFP